jgi:hypothetical protein
MCRSTSRRGRWWTAKAVTASDARGAVKPWPGVSMAGLAVDVFEGLDPGEPFTTAKLNQNCSTNGRTMRVTAFALTRLFSLCFELSPPRVPITWEAYASAAGSALGAHSRPVPDAGPLTSRTS